MKKIAIFASGSGSNAENIIQYFAQKPQFCVKSVFCNVPDAYVLERAKNTMFRPLFLTGQNFVTRRKCCTNYRQTGSILSYWPVFYG